MSESSGELDPSVYSGTKDQPRSLEHYLPPGYPSILFQGTSLDNSERIKKNGLGGGTLTTWIFDSLDDRFYRPVDGRLIIAKYSPQTFETGTNSDWQAFQFYSVRENTGPKRTITYTSVDTDHVDSEVKQVETTRYVDPAEMGSLSLSEAQGDYLGLILELFRGRHCGTFNQHDINRVAEMLKKNNLPDTAAGVAGRGVTINMLMSAGFPPDTDVEIKYRSYLSQQQLASILELTPADFVDFPSLKKAIISHFGTEDQLIQRLTEKFPGQLRWDWKNFNLQDADIICKIIRQIYQREVIIETDTLIKDQQRSTSCILLPGESIRNLNLIRQEKGLETIQ